MKIGIISLHRTSNYGGVLQPFALQRKFEELGYQVEIIDFYPECNTVMGQLKLLKGKSSKFNNPVIYVMAIGTLSISYIKKKFVFEKYIKKNLNLSEITYHTETDFERSIPEADIYCSGGDQVWHGYVKPRFFPFLKPTQKLISYAASFGKDSIDPENFEKIKKELLRFSHISVREDSGLKLLESMGIMDGKWVLDSTLLYNAKQWKPYVSDKYKGKQFILTYNLHHDDTVEELAKELSKKHKIPVYNICMHWFEIYRYGKCIWCPSVEDYLSLFYNASYVIGDSFHGTVFSILFHKKFLSVIPDTVGTRIGSIARLLDLEERIAHTGTKIDPVLMEQEIDYKKVDSLLEEQRKYSVAYMKESLEN